MALLYLLVLGCSAMSGGRDPTNEEHFQATRTSAAARRLAPTEAPRLNPVPTVDHVLLLTVDAFRGDQPWVGYDAIETPNLTKLAQRSLVYTRNYSLANITTASLNGMLASRYPSELHREACIFGKYALHGSLAPYLQSGSTATFAAHGQPALAGRIAPSLGFEKWKLVRGAGNRQQAEGAVVGAEIADLVIGYLTKELPQNRSLFVWAHFPDPHDAYVAHPAFPPKARTTRARYDSEVAYTDAAIGRVLDAVNARGLQNRTAIIVTADHGEAFGEHGMLGHGFTMFEEEIRVPLLVHLPGIGHRTINTPRSTLDVAPTIVELLGYAAPAEWRGRSLLHDVADEPPERRTVIVDLPEMKGRARKQVVIKDTLKVIMTREGPSVFDLAEDPKERSPIPKDSDRGRAAIKAAREELSRLETVRAVPCST